MPAPPVASQTDNSRIGSGRTERPHAARLKQTKESSSPRAAAAETRNEQSARPTDALNAPPQGGKGDIEQRPNHGLRGYGEGGRAGRLEKGIFIRMCFSNSNAGFPHSNLKNQIGTQDFEIRI